MGATSQNRKFLEGKTRISPSNRRIFILRILKMKKIVKKILERTWEILGSFWENCSKI